MNLRTPNSNAYIPPLGYMSNCDNIYCGCDNDCCDGYNCNNIGAYTYGRCQKNISQTQNTYLLDKNYAWYTKNPEVWLIILIIVIGLVIVGSLIFR